MHAIRLNPQRADYYEGAGAANSRLGRDREALECFSRALALDPNDSYTYSSRAGCSYELGNYQASLADANQALQLDPHNDNARFHRGRAWRALGDKQRAFEQFNELLARDPSWFLAWKERGSLYLDAGWFQQAAADFDRLIQQKPDVMEHYFLRAKAWRGLNDFARANQDLQHADYLMRERVSDVAQRGRMVQTAIVQAFNELYRAGLDSNAYAAVVLSFDPQLQQDLQRLKALALRVGELKGAPCHDRQEQAISQSLASERATKYRRLPLPLAWTNGVPAYLADVYIYRRFLPNGSHLDGGGLLACVAEDGAAGRIELRRPRKARKAAELLSFRHALNVFLTGK